MRHFTNRYRVKWPVGEKLALFSSLLALPSVAAVL
jgi:hypothetical protein